MTTVTDETLDKIKTLASIWQDYYPLLETKPELGIGSEYFYDWLEWYAPTMELCHLYLRSGIMLGYFNLTDKFLPEIDEAYNVFELITANERGNPDDFPAPWYSEYFEFTEWHRPTASITVGGN